MRKLHTIGRTRCLNALCVGRADDWQDVGRMAEQPRNANRLSRHALTGCERIHHARGTCKQSSTRMLSFDGTTTQVAPGERCPGLNAYAMKPAVLERPGHVPGSYGLVDPDALVEERVVDDVELQLVRNNRHIDEASQKLELRCAVVAHATQPLQARLDRAYDVLSSEIEDGERARCIGKSNPAFRLEQDGAAQSGSSAKKHSEDSFRFSTTVNVRVVEQGHATFERSIYGPACSFDDFSRGFPIFPTPAKVHATIANSSTLNGAITPSQHSHDARQTIPHSEPCQAKHPMSRAPSHSCSRVHRQQIAAELQALASG